MEFDLAARVSIITIAVNIILAIIKVAAGILGSSSAMVADGIHTVSDVFTTVIAFVGIRISSKKPDDNHPYGHEKFESVFAKLLSIILFLTGLFIGYEAIKILVSGEFTVPGKVALYAAIISIIVKESMYRYTIRAANKLRSISLEADAWHHRSDALSSVGTLVGVLGARLGFPALDPIAGIIVSVMVIKVGVELYLKSVSELVDEAASKKTIEQIETLTRETEGVKRINELRTRISGNTIFIDMDIVVDGSITVREGHDIAKKVNTSIRNEIEDINDCMIHVEPDEE